MGLDIFIFRYKRTQYEKYKEAQEKWEEEKPACYDLSEEEYEKLPEEAKNKVHEEIAKWYEKQPKSEDYGQEEVGYFRKVNFLVGYFNYEENCSNQEITMDEIKMLLERCREVLKHKSKSKAELLLPVQQGFFFGSYNYDDWYFGDVKEVRDWCAKIIKEADQFPDTEYIYLFHCWW